MGYLTAGQLIWHARRTKGDFLSTSERWLLLAGSLSGAACGAYALGIFEDPPGKTIVGGLIGATLAVEALKWSLRITRRTGDIYAVPMLIGIAIGRIGCFLTGLPDNTHGNPTSLPWGYDFGDGIPRHPTQLYDIAFCLAYALLLRRPLPNLREGDRYRLFLNGYLAWRFCIDFLKPAPTYFHLAPIQWAALLTLTYYACDTLRRPK